MNDDWRVWGYWREALPATGRTALLWVYVDLTGSPEVDPLLDRVAAKFAASEAKFRAEYDGRLIFGLVVFGVERPGAPLVDLHRAYNRMWDRHPDVWTLVRSYGPMTFWLVDSADRPHFGIIQDGMHGTEEQWANDDLRWVEQFYVYRSSTDVRWWSVVQPIDPTNIDLARAAGRSLRPGG